MRFELEGAGMRYGESEVLRDVTLRFEHGQLTALAGANGAGKSTLIGIMSGQRAPTTGTCRLDEKPVQQWPRRDFARVVSTVPQSLRVEFPFTAAQVVLMGRTPHVDGLFESAQDLSAVDAAMRLTDTLQFRDRDFRTLSGGEKQRVVVAAALAQSPRVLLMDEPTAFLDLEHQVSLYRLLRKQCGEGLMGVIVTHDLNLAASYADRIVVLHQGRVVADGTPAEVIQPAVLESAFRVRVDVRPGVNGRPWIVYGD